MNNLKTTAQEFVQRFQPRIGTAWMEGQYAKIGNPADGSIFVTDGNFPANKQVYVHFVTDGDVVSVIEALAGSYTRDDLRYDRPVLIKKHQSGMFYISDLDPVQDAIFSEGIEKLDNGKPIYLRQLVEIGTLHPVAGALRFQVSQGMFDNTRFDGLTSADFSTGTVQDTTPANITLPTTNGLAKGVLVQLDPVTPALEYKQSGTFDSTLSLPQAYKAGLLPAPDATRYRLGYVKLTYGSTVFDYASIWQAPELMTKGAIGDITANTLILNDGSELTIATGAITVTKTRHTVDTEADAATDDLVTVNGLAANEICVITANNTARTVVVKNSGGNISCASGADIALDDNIKAVLLMGNTAGTGVNAYPLFGTGDVVGPASSTDNAIARYDGITGKLIQNSAVTIDDLGGVFISPTANINALWIKQHSIQTVAPLVITDNGGVNQIQLLANGGATFNEGANDVDFRVRSVTNVNTLFVDGGNNNVGIGTGTPDASALLDIVSTTKGLGLPSQTTAQRTAIGTPRDGLVVYDSDLDLVYVRANGAWAEVGSSPPFVDTTAIVKGSVDATKLLRFEVDGFTTATTRVLTPPNYDGTIATLAGIETLTNKTIDADGTGNFITNIGSSEVKAELITGLTADATPDGAADYVMTYDASAATLKKVLLNNLPTVVFTATHTYKAGVDYATTSGSFVDVDATNVAITGVAGATKALVVFIFAARKATAGTAYFRILQNGATASPTLDRAQALNASNMLMVVAHVFTAGAGADGYKLQYYSSDANSAVVDSDLTIQAFIFGVK